MITAGVFVATSIVTFEVVALPVTWPAVMDSVADPPDPSPADRPRLPDEVAADELAERVDVDVVVVTRLAHLDLEPSTAPGSTVAEWLIVQSSSELSTRP